MRAGKLDKRAEIIRLTAALTTESRGSRWVGIRAKDAIDVPAADGLRSMALVEIRARYSDEFSQGRYLASVGRLFHITSARDPLGNRAEMVISAHELIGQPAEYRPQEGVPVPCRVHLTHEAPYRDEMGQVTDYKTRAEIAVIEVGRPQQEDQLLIAGTLYTVIAYADETDDGVVRGLWLEKV